MSIKQIQSSLDVTLELFLKVWTDASRISSPKKPIEVSAFQTEVQLTLIVHLLANLCTPAGKLAADVVQLFSCQIHNHQNWLHICFPFFIDCVVNSAESVYIFKVGKKKNEQRNNYLSVLSLKSEAISMFCLYSCRVFIGCVITIKLL